MISDKFRSAKNIRKTINDYELLCEELSYVSDELFSVTKMMLSADEEHIIAYGTNNAGEDSSDTIPIAWLFMSVDELIEEQDKIKRYKKSWNTHGIKKY